MPNLVIPRSDRVSEIYAPQPFVLGINQASPSLDNLVHLGCTIGSTVEEFGPYTGALTTPSGTQAIGSSTAGMGLDPHNQYPAHRTMGSAERSGAATNTTTFAWCMYWDGSVSGRWAAGYGQNYAQNNYYGYSLFLSLGQLIAFQGSNGFSPSTRNVRASPANTMTSGLHVILGRYYGGGSSNAPDLFFDGEPVAGTTTAGTSTTISFGISGGQVLYAGVTPRNDGGISWDTLPGISFWTAAWERHLSNEEIRFLSKEGKWSLFDAGPGPSPIVISDTAAPPAGSAPVYLFHNRHHNRSA